MNREDIVSSQAAAGYLMNRRNSASEQKHFSEDLDRDLAQGIGIHAPRINISHVPDELLGVGGPQFLDGFVPEVSQESCHSSAPGGPNCRQLVNHEPVLDTAHAKFLERPRNSSFCQTIQAGDKGSLPVTHAARGPHLCRLIPTPHRFLNAVGAEHQVRRALRPEASGLSYTARGEELNGIG